MTVVPSAIDDGEDSGSQIRSGMSIVGYLLGVRSGDQNRYDLTISRYA